MNKRSKAARLLISAVVVSSGSACTEPSIAGIPVYTTPAPTATPEATPTTSAVQPDKAAQ
jgi:hypothetical protein